MEIHPVFRAPFPGHSGHKLFGQNCCAPAARRFWASARKSSAGILAGWQAALTQQSHKIVRRRAMVSCSEAALGLSLTVLIVPQGGGFSVVVFLIKFVLFCAIRPPPSTSVWGAAPAHGRAQTGAPRPAAEKPFAKRLRRFAIEKLLPRFFSKKREKSLHPSRAQALPTTALSSFRSGSQNSSGGVRRRGRPPGPSPLPRCVRSCGTPTP